MREGDFRAKGSFGLRDLGVIEGSDDPAFDNIVALAARAMGTPLAAFVVADIERDRVKVRSSFGFHAVTRHTEGLPLGPSLTAVVMETGHCLAIPDMRLHPRTARHPYLAAIGARSLLIAPVKCPADLVIGSVMAMDRLPRIWTEEEKVVLQGFAFMCGQNILLRAALRTLTVVTRDTPRSATMN